MQTEFFLLNASFRCPKDITIQDIESAIESLSTDYDFIKNEKDTISRHEEIYDIDIYPNYKVEDLYYKNKKCPFSHDTKKFLLKMIDHSKETDWSNEQVLDLINHQETENLCESKTNYGLFALFKTTDEMNENYIVYNQRNWLTFHRYFLSKFPCNATYFIHECKRYFPNLHFHDRNEGAVGRILKDCCKKIIHHLSCLNDFFPDCKNIPYNRIETMKLFNAKSNFDRDASIEGDVQRKKDLSFCFETENNTKELIYCELHLKLIYDDKNVYSQNRRIYFHEGKPNIQKGKILVGHIGEHL